jgi:hypothetical protein
MTVWRAHYIKIGKNIEQRSVSDAYLTIYAQIN